MRFFLLLSVSSALFAQQESVTIEEYEPKSLLVVPEHKTPRAKFPFIDVHNHQRGSSPERVDQLIRDMDRINMRVMVNLSGGFGETLERNVQALKGRYKDRFVVFANLNFQDIDASDWGQKAAAQLERDVRNGAQGLKIFKNLGMDLKDGKGQRIHTDDPRFDPVWDMCGQLGIPVLIHTGEPKGLFLPMDKNNERWLELKRYPKRGRMSDYYPSWETIMEEQRNMFARHPKTTYIAAHLDWLGIDLAALGRLLDRLPNVNTEIGAVVEELARQPRFARQFFIKYQDRVMFGKDTWNPAEYPTYFRILETADEYFDHDRKYHGMWKAYGLDLPEDVLQKLYYKNALRVIPGIDPSPFPK